MKSYSFILKVILSITLLIAVSSCESDDLDENSNFVMADVDGRNFQVSGLLVEGNFQSTNSGEAFVIVGVKFNSSYILLGIGTENEITTGTYEISNATTDQILAVYSIPVEGSMDDETQQFNAVSDGSSISGNIVITRLTENRISGTFEFIGREEQDPTSTVTVTNGRFNFNIE